ncbi:MAG: hypothetical protein J2P21_26850 [Chloracidobacterium sp.]|nr:hypothetical protein [Chloracidobacterium sp.]
MHVKAYAGQAACRRTSISTSIVGAGEGLLPGSGVLLIETDSEKLARWIIDCINAAVMGPRPEGAIFKCGRFRIYEDHRMSAQSTIRDSMGYGVPQLAQLGAEDFSDQLPI